MRSAVPAGRVALRQLGAFPSVAAYPFAPQSAHCSLVAISRKNWRHECCVPRSRSLATGTPSQSEGKSADGSTPYYLRLHAMPVRATCDDSTKESGEERSELGPLPRTLFRARSLKKERLDAENALSLSAAGQSCGLGLAFLGIAAFTPPLQFMTGLLVATFQVRLVYAWQMREVRAQARRHVVEIVQTEDADESGAAGAITIECDGVTRTLDLSLRDSVGAVGKAAKRPPLADIFKHAKSCLTIPEGEAVNGGAFDELLSSERVIAKEELVISAFADEAKADVEKRTPSLADLTPGDLEKLAQAKPSEVKAQLEKIVLGARLTSGVVFVGGAFLCIAGRSQADAFMPHEVTGGAAAERLFGEASGVNQ